MDKVTNAAREIAQRATEHAFHNRVKEAVYLYRLSVSFIDRALAICGNDPSVSNSSFSVTFLIDARKRYLAYIESVEGSAAASTPPQPQPVRGPARQPSASRGPPQRIPNSRSQPNFDQHVHSGEYIPKSNSGRILSGDYTQRVAVDEQVSIVNSGEYVPARTSGELARVPAAAAAVLEKEMVEEEELGSVQMVVKKAESALGSNDRLEALNCFQQAVEMLLEEEEERNEPPSMPAPAQGVAVHAKRALPASAQLDHIDRIDRHNTSQLKDTLAKIDNLTTVDFQKDEILFHERLGGGGSGSIVLRATARGLTFAAKVLSAEMPPDVIDAVLWEIMVMTKLNSPYVVHYLGHDISKDNKIILYMEYYTETLSGVIKKRRKANRPTTPEEVANWGMQVIKGISYLHNLDPPIIHRDLKADNVFAIYDAEGRVERLKIGDFDTAIITEAARVTYTRNLGTVGFMAPEVCTPGEKGYGDKADIWSFGMMLYEMIQMQVPFYNVQPMQRYEYQRRGERPVFDLGDRAAAFAPLIAIFQKCTEKNPGMRPTAKKLIKEFAELL